MDHVAAGDTQDESWRVRLAQWTTGAFAVGILLRLCVWATCSPVNPDLHLELVEHVARTWSLPVSSAGDQAYQPPLYYVLMAPLFALGMKPGLVHLASLAMSIANLWLIRRVVFHPVIDSFVSAPARVAAFTLAALLPQFVIFSHFISNDSLTFLIGSAQLLALLAYMEKRSWQRAAAIAALGAAGMLTKGTFLIAPLVLAACVWLVDRLRAPRDAEPEAASRRPSHSALVAVSIAVVGLVLGSYKYVDNYARMGRFIVHNQDFENPVIRAQRAATWRGPSTLFNVNPVDLLRQPVIRPSKPGSYPQVFYATAWYAYIPESSYLGNMSGYAWMGRVAYIAGFVPTLLLLAGVAIAMPAAWRAAVASITQAKAASHRDAVLAICALLLLTNFVIVVAAGLKYQNWACFQARLCFQSMAPMVILLAIALDVFRSRRAKRAAIACVVIASATGPGYILTEAALAQGMIKPVHAPTPWWDLPIPRAEPVTRPDAGAAATRPSR